MKRASQGFSLIEMLVVVTIILLLMGLLIAGIPAVQAAQRSARSQAILQLAANAITQHSAQRGGGVQLVEHPLAGSLAAAGTFVRADGSAMAGAGLALVAPAVESLPPAQQSALLGADLARLLRHDDRFADPSVPMLFGMERSALHVAGAGLPEVTRYLRLALTASGQLTRQSGVPMATLVKPGWRLDARSVPIDYADTLAEHAARGEPDGDRLLAEYADDQRRRTVLREALGYLLGGEGPGAELARLGALHETPDDEPARRIRGGRVWSPPGEQAGLARPYGVLFSGADPVRYRLRGLALYDAWGREIVAQPSARGDVVLLSAGRDGGLAIAPGPNGRIDTADPLGPPAGDDRAGQADNLASSGGKP